MDGLAHVILMKFSKNYRLALSENERLAEILAIKERKLASSDEQVSSLSESVRYLSNKAKEQKKILKANNLL